MDAAALSHGARSGLSELLIRPRAHRTDRTSRNRTRHHELLAVRGVAGDFLVPAGSGSRAARTLLAYNGLRPPRIRAARTVVAGALALGLGRWITDPCTLTVAAGRDSLVEHLATVLGEPGLVFAGTDRERDGFVTPVLQLFSPTGSCVGFAKIGWDRVTRAMIDTEAHALTLAARARLGSVHVPAVAWHGRWYDLTVLVTAPMPAGVTRLPGRASVPIEPLVDIATIDGPLTHEPLRASSYWRDAARTVSESAIADRHGIADRFEQLDAQHGDVPLTFGRWHGDWVPWNLARAGASLHAWDWAYSAPAVPFGFDALHFTFLPAHVLHGATAIEASARAARVTAPALASLGLGAEQQRAVVALHRFEQELRDERAWLTRHAAEPAVPRPGR